MNEQRPECLSEQDYQVGVCVYCRGASDSGGPGQAVRDLAGPRLWLETGLCH